MNRNLKILDAVDRTENIYVFILKLSERAHVLLASGTAQSSASGETNVVQKVLAEWIEQASRDISGKPPAQDDQEQPASL